METSSKKLRRDRFGNAIESLRHGMDHFDQFAALVVADPRTTDLKFAVLHMAHAAELLLKDAVYSARDDLGNRWKLGKPKQTSFSRLIKLFKSDEDFQATHAQTMLKNLDALRDVRNAIEHDAFDMTLEEARTQIGYALAGIKWILREFFDTRIEEYLEEVLPGGSWEEYIYDDSFEPLRQEFADAFHGQHPGLKPLTCTDCEAPALRHLSDRCPACHHQEATVNCSTCSEEYSSDNPHCDNVNHDCIDCNLRFVLAARRELQRLKHQEYSVVPGMDASRIESFLLNGASLSETEWSKLTTFLET